MYRHCVSLCEWKHCVHSLPCNAYRQTKYNWQCLKVWPTPVLLPGKSHGRRSLVGCRPWGHEESDTTERLHFPFSLSCIGEGNGNPLQCSCLENPRDGGAWWAAVYGHDWSDLAVIDSRGSQHFQIWGNGGKVTNWYRLKITCLKSWGLESRIWGLWRILTPHWNLGQHSETLYFCSETC